MKSSRRTKLILGLALVVAAPGTLAIHSYGRVSGMIHPARVHVTVEDEAGAKRDLPGLEDVTFRTTDGLALRAWFAPGSRRAAVVFVHGGGGNRTQLLPEARILASHGYGVLAYDSRASGESDGDLVTCGDHEQRDVAAAIDFVSARAEIDSKRIGILGFSIGASTVALEAAGDPRVRAVVLYATWSSMEDEIKGKAHRFGPLSWGPVLFGLRRQGIDVDAVRPIDHVAEIGPRPLLMIAGTDDSDTPVAVMKRVFEAASEPKELWVEPHATHGHCVEAAPEEYEKRVVGFFDRSL